MPDRKTLTIFRGQSKVNFLCDNGDTYDSSATLSGKVDGRPIDYWHSEFVNTDSTVKGPDNIEYKGGKLAKGNYFGIVGYRQPKKGQAQGKRVIKLFLGHPSAVETDKDLTDQMMTLPSEIPNPNHNGLPIIQFVQIHDGGKSWDWSHGCLTIYKYAHAVIPSGSDWDRLMALLKDNEIINITLQ